MYQLAPRAGLHQSALGLIESGKRNPTLATLLRVSEVLGVNLGELLIRAKKEVQDSKDSVVEKAMPKKDETTEAPVGPAG